VEEDCHLLNVLYYVSGFPLHLICQSIHEQHCDCMALERERCMRPMSIIAEVFGCVGGIFGLLLIRACVKCKGEEVKSFNLKDKSGFWQRPGLEEYRFGQMKNCLVEVIILLI
jgi:hypothetical protein